MVASLKVSGLKELEANLVRLRPGVGKAAMTRALLKAGQPMADIARSLAPDDEVTGGYDLRESIVCTTRLSRRQRALHRKMFKDDKASAEVFVGPGPLPAAHNQEFGNVRHGAQPYMRPAWDQDKRAFLDRLVVSLRAELQKSLARAIKRGTVRS